AHATSIAVAATPPALPNLSPADFSMSKPITLWPAFMRFRAIGRPMLPRPMKPICVMLRSPGPHAIRQSGSFADPLLQIRDELFGGGTFDQGARIGPECANRGDIVGHLSGLAHGLRIIGCKHCLLQWDLLEAEANPFGPPRAGMVGAGPAGTVIEQALFEIMIE